MRRVQQGMLPVLQEMPLGEQAVPPVASAELGLRLRAPSWILVEMSSNWTSLRLVKASPCKTSLTSLMTESCALV